MHEGPKANPLDNPANSYSPPHDDLLVLNQSILVLPQTIGIAGKSYTQTKKHPYCVKLIWHNGVF